MLESTDVIWAQSGYPLRGTKWRQTGSMVGTLQLYAPATRATFTDIQVYAPLKLHTVGPQLQLLLPNPGHYYRLLGEIEAGITVVSERRIITRGSIRMVMAYFKPSRLTESMRRSRRKLCKRLYEVCGHGQGSQAS